jgi:hypothetical protein
MTDNNEKQDQQGSAQPLHDLATQIIRQGAQQDTKQNQDRAQGKLKIIYKIPNMKSIYQNRRSCEKFKLISCNLRSEQVKATYGKSRSLPILYCNLLITDFKRLIMNYK